MKNPPKKNFFLIFPFASWGSCLYFPFKTFQTGIPLLKLSCSFISLTFPNFFLHIFCQENDWILLPYFSLQNGQSRPHQSSPHLDFKINTLDTVCRGDLNPIMKDTIQNQDELLSLVALNTVLPQFKLFARHYALALHNASHKCGPKPCRATLALRLTSE